MNIFIQSIFIDNMVFAFFFGMCSSYRVEERERRPLVSVPP